MLQLRNFADSDSWLLQLLFYTDTWNEIAQKDGRFRVQFFLVIFEPSFETLDEQIRNSSF